MKARKTGIAATLLIVTAACGSGVDSDPGADAAPGNAIDWQAGTVRLEADDFYYRTDGVNTLFDPDSGSVEGGVHSDTSATLEVYWTADDYEARVYFYFEADDTVWWAPEIRTYDPGGAEWGGEYRGQFFETPRGETFEGDIDLELSPDPGGTRLHASNARLHVFDE